MKKIAILQSSYIPWKGHFDIINEVDTFVFYDCVQFTRRDWRTRNYVKTPTGRQLLSVPVHGTITKPINTIKVDTNKSWQEEHRKSFDRNYGHAEFFHEYKFLLDGFYNKKKWMSLSELNQALMMKISQLLGIKTTFIDSRELKLTGSRTDRLLNALIKLGADVYVSGPSAKGYINNSKFEQAGIKLVYKDYSNYPEYKQLWGGFTHYVTVLDLIFNTGKKAPYYIWGWRD